MSILIRITDSDDLDKNALFEYLSKHESLGVFEEPHDNPHYHFWLKSPLKHDTVQRHLKVIKGVADRKFAVRSQDGNLNYMCKGPKAVSKLKSKDYPGTKVFPKVVLNTMKFTDDEIAAAHEEWWRDANEWKDKKVKPRKGSDKTWFEVLIEHCMSRGCTVSTAGWELAASIIDAYRVYLKCEPNDFQIKCYAKSIQRELVYRYSVENGRTHVYESYLKERAKQVIGNEWIHVRI